MDRLTLASLLRIASRIVFWAVLPLMLGSVLALVLIPVPRVAVIRFEDIIWRDSALDLGELLERAEEDRRIRAVVLELDSPGGEVTATEEVYYRLLQLRQHKPVVITVGTLAASGGYYIAAAGDYVFAKPTSLLGNVGVISFLPSADEQRFADEDYVSTGPFKFSGGSRGDFMRQIELSKQGFLEAVFAQRGDKLSISREQLSSGEVFMGLQSVRLGLVDELGADGEAVEKAASLARIAHYRVERIEQSAEPDILIDEKWAAQGRLDAMLAAGDPRWHQGLYYLYVEPTARAR